jgi:hypothetical protein
LTKEALVRDDLLESAVRCLFGLFTAASVVALVMIGTRALSLNLADKGNVPQGERVALENAPVRAETRRRMALEAKIGECHARGGVASLDPQAGYTGCDFPVAKSRSR